MRGLGGPILFLPLLWCSCGSPTVPDPPTQQVMGLPDTVTFADHIAPLVWANCTPCHRPGQAGPFPLVGYRDVRKKARTIQLVTSKGYMPPWPADTSYSRFLGERTLTAREIALIAKWVEQGTLAGDTGAMPSPPHFAEGSLLGEPDAVVWLPEAFAIPGDNTDRFMVSKAPFTFERDTFLRAIEFVPGNRRAVHHMNGAIIQYAEGAKRDVFAGERYVDADRTASRDAFERLALANDDGTYPALTPNATNYLPGLLPPILPDGIGGYRIKRQGAFLMNTIHYGPSLRDTTDRSRFNLWFAPRAPERPMREIQIGTLGLTPVVPELVIPADSIKTFHSSYTLPAAISVVSLNPHMHLLGKHFVAYAVTPTNDTVPLVRINDWDFRWQYVYTFEHLLTLPQGSVIHVFGTFDNTADNKSNPFSPPREARAPKSGHMRTTDEMFQFFVNYVDHRPGDEHISLAPADRAPSPPASH
ncbi:MAG TPA: hypothetical protein VGE21_01795 [Flavobacteriales bacterium]